MILLKLILSLVTIVNNTWVSGLFLIYRIEKVTFQFNTSLQQLMHILHVINLWNKIQFFYKKKRKRTCKDIVLDVYVYVSLNFL